jgi:very-short-patch-repair endonuclease
VTSQKAENSHRRGSGATKRSGSALEDHLAHSLALLGAPAFEREYRFSTERRFRLDFAWPDLRLGVEVEGGVYRGGGHTTVNGIRRDMEKSNLLTLLGWRLLRFHGDQVRSGEAASVIAELLREV